MVQEVLLVMFHYCRYVNLDLVTTHRARKKECYGHCNVGNEDVYFNAKPFSKLELLLSKFLKDLIKVKKDLHCVDDNDILEEHGDDVEALESHVARLSRFEHIEND